MSSSVRLHRQKPIRFPQPWNSPGKNTGVGCHFLLQGMKVKNEREVVQSCLTLSDPVDYSLPRLLHPWDSPGKSAGVGCHCLLWSGCIYLFQLAAQGKKTGEIPWMVKIKTLNNRNILWDCLESGAHDLVLWYWELPARRMKGYRGKAS